MYLNTVFKYNVFKYCPALTATNITPLTENRRHPCHKFTSATPPQSISTALFPSTKTPAFLPCTKAVLCSFSPIQITPPPLQKAPCPKPPPIPSAPPTQPPSLAYPCSVPSTKPSANYKLPESLASSPSSPNPPPSPSPARPPASPLLAWCRGPPAPWGLGRSATLGS